MPSAGGAGPHFLQRVDAVDRRLERHLRVEHAGLTAPDESSGERWEAGQVWAHLAEFCSYWIAEARSILASATDGPVPFGRTKSDPGRLGAIERDRHEPPARLHAKLVDQLDELRAVIATMPEAGWRTSGRHPTLGVMTMEQIFEEFLVGHLEEHADQLDQVAAGGT